MIDTTVNVGIGILIGVWLGMYVSVALKKNSLEERCIKGFNHFVIDEKRIAIEMSPIREAVACFTKEQLGKQ